MPQPFDYAVTEHIVVRRGNEQHVPSQPRNILRHIAAYAAVDQANLAHIAADGIIMRIGKALDIDEYGADYGDCFLCAHRQTSRPRRAELSGLLYYSPFRLSSGAFPSENLLLFQKNA